MFFRTSVTIQCKLQNENAFFVTLNSLNIYNYKMKMKLLFGIELIQHIQLQNEMILCWNFELTQHIQLQNANEIYVGCFTSLNIHSYKMQINRTIKTTTKMLGHYKMGLIYKKHGTSPFLATK